MIERYSRKQMVDIWSQQEKFNIWFQIEAHACDAQAELGVIPADSAKIIWEKGQFDIDRIDEIEKTTKHDVIAFLTNLTEYITRCVNNDFIIIYFIVIFFFGKFNNTIIFSCPR